MAVVAVIGASGRVGREVARFLEDAYEVRRIHRDCTKDAQHLADSGARDASVILNFAGVAHVTDTTPATAARLHAANVELPTVIATASLAVGASMIHLSSIKATSPSSSAYAASKRQGDDALERGFGDAFAGAGKALVVVRPPALLFPPFDAGKVRHLRFLRHVPAALVPDVQLPVLTAEMFERTVESVVANLVSERPDTGFSVREFQPSERGTLRDIGNAFRTQNQRNART